MLFPFTGGPLHDGARFHPTKKPAVTVEPLPPELEEALDELQAPGDFHAGGVYSLPHPGLHISGMSYPIALPLLPSQAEEIVNIARQSPHGKGLQTVVDTAVRDCMEIDPCNVTFCNTEWPKAIEKLVVHAAEKLGVPATKVSSGLYKLLLYRRGGHFKPHRDTEKVKGMFATLTVQLPSKFTGGALVLRHRDRQIVYTSGTLDSKCQFSTFYTAFFADVQHEIRPIEDGYRLALVYNIFWTADGAPPSAAQNQLHTVSEEMRNLANESKDGTWMLAFGLEHQYTPSSLEVHGTGALKGKDRSKVGALTSAAKAAGLGELELLLHILSRTDTESGEGDYDGFEVYDKEEGEISVAHVYHVNGSQCNLDLNFIDWEGSIKDEIDFDLEEEDAVEYTGNEGATRETMYGATCVALWPKNKSIEILGGSSKNLPFLLHQAQGNEQAALDRVLDLMKDEGSALADSSSSWQQLQFIFDFCVKNNLAQQSNRAIQVAATVIGPMCEFPIHEKLSQAVVKFGWEAVSNSIESFLCPKDISRVQQIGARMNTLELLGAAIPEGLQRRSIATALEFARSKGSVLGRKPSNASKDDDTRARIWRLLLKCLDSLYRASHQKGCSNSVTDLISRLAGICAHIDEDELIVVEGLLARMNAKAPSNPMNTVKCAIDQHLREKRSKRFCSEVQHIIKRKALPPRYCGNRNYGWSLPRLVGPDWSSFLSLVARVLSAEPVVPECERCFRSFLSILSSLPRESREAMSRALLGRGGNVGEQRIRGEIKKSLQYANDVAAERKLLKKVKDLEQITAIVPEKVQVEYPADNLRDFPEVQSFLRGREMTLRMSGYYSVIYARKELKSFQGRLPRGIGSRAGGVGRGSFVLLEKPFAEKYPRWLQYESNWKLLNKVRSELEMTQSRLRGVTPFEKGAEQPVSKKRKVDSASEGGRQSIVCTGGHLCRQQ